MDFDMMIRSSESKNHRKTMSSKNLRRSNPFATATMFFHRILTMADNCFSASSSSASKASIQILYNLCRRTLTPSNSPPTTTTIDELSLLLDEIGPTDVGLMAGNQEDRQSNRVDRWARPITYVEIYENSNFTMCMFCFPKSSVIPLHDHPGMTVLSKVLYGSLHVKAYDWVEPPHIKETKGISQGRVRLAKLAVDQVLTAPCSASILYPKTGGNLHCFTAATSCAVLDILSPPYEEAAGRKCTYYRDHPYSTFRSEGDRTNEKDEEYAWLEEIDAPDDLYMQQGTYTGPRSRARC